MAAALADVAHVGPVHHTVRLGRAYFAARLATGTDVIVTVQARPET